MTPRAISCPQRHPMVSTGPCIRPRLWRDGLGIMHQIPGVVELAFFEIDLQFSSFAREYLQGSREDRFCACCFRKTFRWVFEASRSMVERRIVGCVFADAFVFWFC